MTGNNHQLQPLMKGLDMKLIRLIPLFVFCMTSVAQGHMLWLAPAEHSLKSGGTTTIDIGWGHSYPGGEKLKEENIEGVFAVDSSGRRTQLERIAPARYRFAPRSKGNHTIVVTQRPGFMSTTPDGRRMGSRREHGDAVSCMHFAMSGKTVISVGSKDRKRSGRPILPFEIIPLKGTDKARVGDEVSLMLYFNGKPLPNVKLKAVDADSARRKEGSWAQEAVSDSKGVARIRLGAKGQWLITAHYEKPYQDTAVCDKDMYLTTLTLTIK